MSPDLPPPPPLFLSLASIPGCFHSLATSLRLEPTTPRHLIHPFNLVAAVLEFTWPGRWMSIYPQFSGTGLVRLGAAEVRIKTGSLVSLPLIQDGPQSADSSTQDVPRPTCCGTCVSVQTTRPLLSGKYTVCQCLCAYGTRYWRCSPLLGLLLNWPGGREGGREGGKGRRGGGLAAVGVLSPTPRFCCGTWLPSQ